MFRTAIEGLAQMAYLNALAFGVRRIYFLGSFINIPLARELITTELEGRILLRPKVLICSSVSLLPLTLKSLVFSFSCIL